MQLQAEQILEPSLINDVRQLGSKLCLQGGCPLAGTGQLLLVIKCAHHPTGEDILYVSCCRTQEVQLHSC